MNIAELFERQARTRPNAGAILDVLRGRERTLTFAELMNKAAEVASLLHSQGLQPGDGVIAHPPARRAWLAVASGAPGLGVPSHVLSVPRRWRCSALCRARGLVGGLVHRRTLAMARRLVIGLARKQRTDKGG